MPFHHIGTIRHYSFDLLNEAGVINAVFTRQGGYSPEPWASLNVGGLLGDDPLRVYSNRVLSFRALNRDPESVYDVWQVHGADVLCASTPRPARVPHKKADAILADRPEISLFMRFADCVPVLFCDPVKSVIGIAHAGWKGTVNGIISEVLETMQTVYGCRPVNVIAAIGPSICVDHYQVGPEVIDQVRTAFGEDSNALLREYNGICHFDLWMANRLALERIGIRQIELSGICTACHLDDWYSHRAENGRTGRFGVLMALKS